MNAGKLVEALRETATEIENIFFTLERAESARDQAQFQCVKYKDQKMALYEDLKAVRAQKTYPPKLIEIVQSLLDKHFPEGLID